MFGINKKTKVTKDTIVSEEEMTKEVKKVTNKKPKKKKKTKKQKEIRVERSDNVTKRDWAKEFANKTSATYNSTGAVLLKFLKPLSNLFDKIIFNQKFSLITSFLIAVIMVVGFNFGNLQDLTSYQMMTTKEDLPVTIVGNTDVYEITGIPESVDAKIVGDLADLQLVQTGGTFTIVADLSGLSEGTHSVPLTAVNYSSKVEVTVEPSSVTVTIARKVSQQYFVGYEYINTNQTDSIYDFGVPTLETSSVIVRASQDTLNKISNVKALIDVTGVTKDFSQDAVLAAYDQEGNKLDVDIVPSTMSVQVPVTSPSKTVPLVIAPIGDIPNGKSVESITLVHESVTLYGSASVLESIDELVIPVDMSNVTSENADAVADITLPSGIKKANIEQVNFTVTLADSETKVFEDVSLRYINYNQDNFKFTLVNAEDATVDVIVTGTAKNLEKVTAENIDAYVDLATIEAGTLSIPIVVVGDNVLVDYSPSRDNLDIIVEAQ